MLELVEQADWYTAAFWWMRRRKFTAGKRYALERVRPHLGGVEPGWVRSLGGELGEPALDLPLYLGPDPAGRLKRLPLRLFGLLAWLPIREREAGHADDALARAELDALFPGLLSPPRTERPRDPAALIDLARAGLAGHRLQRRSDGGFEVDLDALAGLPTRPGYARYGGRLIVGEGLDEVAIAIDGETIASHERGFEAARDRFEASLLTAVTVVDHALYTHFLCGGGLILALRAGTPPDHPLRWALAPFCFNSTRMNEAALLVLLGEGRYLHRVFALTWPGLTELIADGVARFDLRSPPERLAAAGLADRVAELPYWEEALGWWRALEAYAARIVADHVEPEVAESLCAQLVRACPNVVIDGDAKPALARLLAVLMFEVSVGHRQAGNVAPYVQDPRWMPVKVGRGSTEADRRNRHDLIQKTALSFLGTRQHPPRFADDLASTLPAGPLREAWRELDRELIAWEAGLAQRNARRGLAYDDLRRDRVATSAAV